MTTYKQIRKEQEELFRDFFGFYQLDLKSQAQENHYALPIPVLIKLIKRFKVDKSIIFTTKGYTKEERKESLNKPPFEYPIWNPKFIFPNEGIGIICGNKKSAEIVNAKSKINEMNVEFDKCPDEYLAHGVCEEPFNQKISAFFESGYFPSLAKAEEDTHMTPLIKLANQIITKNPTSSRSKQLLEVFKSEIPQAELIIEINNKIRMIRNGQ
jgi:hypothetical protein